MPKKQAKKGCCDTGAMSQDCCKVEYVVTVDERGQMVLPKEVRESAGIKPGDKLAVITMRSGGEVCCISLMKTDNLAGMVKNILGPVFNTITKNEPKKGD